MKLEKIEHFLKPKRKLGCQLFFSCVKLWKSLRLYCYQALVLSILFSNLKQNARNLSNLIKLQTKKQTRQFFSLFFLTVLIQKEVNRGFFRQSADYVYSNHFYHYLFLFLWYWLCKLPWLKGIIAGTRFKQSQDVVLCMRQFHLKVKEKSCHGQKISTVQVKFLIMLCGQWMTLHFDFLWQDAAYR